MSRSIACCGSCGQLAQREVQRLAEHHEPLLRAVVQVAPDPAALLVGGVHGAGAAGDQLVAAGPQGALVAPALELGPGARGEDLQGLQLRGLRVQLARRGDAEVADRARVGAAQRDRQVALDRVRGEELVRRVALARAVGDEQQVLPVGVRAGRAGERELVALAQLHPVRVGAGDRDGVARALLAQLGHEGHLGAERARDLGHEPAQEGGADDPRGARGEAGEQVPIADLGGGGHGDPAMLNRALQTR